MDERLDMSAKLQVNGLNKSFGDLKVLDDINLMIDDSEFISIVGPSGCGKTTFLRIVAGLDQADSGEILIGSERIIGPGSDRGFVFQSDNLLPWRTVLSNTMVGCEVGKGIRQDDLQHAEELLKLVGLAGFERYYPRQLSGGMRQRVNLARALAVRPRILLMDEPFSALDSQTREIMQTELMRIWAEGQKTALFITHQIDEAVYLSDRVFVFARRPGRIQAVIEIDLPRPRPLAIKRSPEFVSYVDKIWSLIEEDVKYSVIHEHE